MQPGWNDWTFGWLNVKYEAKAETSWNICEYTLHWNTLQVHNSHNLFINKVEKDACFGAYPNPLIFAFGIWTHSYYLHMHSNSLLLRWIWSLPEETMLLTAKSKVRCFREASLGWQPSLHKAESSLNNKELTVMAEVFLQVQMHVFWNTSKPFQLLPLTTTTALFLQCSHLTGVLTSGISLLQDVPGVGWSKKAEKTGEGVV